MRKPVGTKDLPAKSAGSRSSKRDTAGSGVPSGRRTKAYQRASGPEVPTRVTFESIRKAAQAEAAAAADPVDLKRARFALHLVETHKVPWDVAKAVEGRAYAAVAAGIPAPERDQVGHELGVEAAVASVAGEWPGARKAVVS